MTEIRIGAKAKVDYYGWLSSGITYDSQLQLYGARIGKRRAVCTTNTEAAKWLRDALVRAVERRWMKRPDKVPEFAKLRRTYTSLTLYEVPYEVQMQVYRSILESYGIERALEILGVEEPTELLFD